MPAKIVIVGSFNTDLTTYMERMPRAGETVNGQRFVTGPGGKGSNQAVAAARLDADVTFVGRVGRDVFAGIALNTWKQEGVNFDFVVQDPDHATGVAPIFVDNTGENMIVVALGANLAIVKADVDAAADTIGQADILVTQLEINYDMVDYALRMAKSRNIRTILNPAPAGELAPETLALADFLTPNETELEVLSGMPNAKPEDAARSLLMTNEQTIIVTLGAQGAMYVQYDRVGQIPGFEVNVVDTTGAGDAFNAGLTVALAENKSLEDAIRFANATAALCVTKPGTAPSMPRRWEVEQLLANTGR
jgi:ribokinase